MEKKKLSSCHCLGIRKFKKVEEKSSCWNEEATEKAYHMTPSAACFSTSWEVFTVNKSEKLEQEGKATSDFVAI